MRIYEFTNLRIYEFTNGRMGAWHQGACSEGGGNVGRARRDFVVNRVLIVLAVAAILAGLSFDQWQIVLRNAILL